MYSDASDTGCAAFIAIDDTPVSHKLGFITDESEPYWREIHCVNFISSEKFSHLLSGCDVKWLTDKQAVPFNCSFW